MLPDSNFHHLSTFIRTIYPVPESSIKSLIDKSKKRTFAKKELFAKEGQIFNELLFIHQGNDFTKDFAVDNSNPFCTALTSFISSEPSEIFIEALEDSMVSFWDRSVVNSIMESSLQWAIFSKRIVEQLYVRKEKKEVAFLKLSAKERYLQFRSDFLELEQRVPQYIIASYLGIKPESLSRIRNRLVKRRNRPSK
jgi:CRP-like cAMP-binding protein